VLWTVWPDVNSVVMSDVTRLIDAAAAGDPVAAALLLPLVYAELRKLADAHISAEKPGQTLQATALVHEAYLRLVRPSGDQEAWKGRGHFFGAAARAMRQILVDAARRKAAEKRGGDRLRLSFTAANDVMAPAEPSADELLDLDAALSRLAAIDPIKARLVELRYFAGLTEVEAAAALGISLATAGRYWLYARSWLFGELHPE
jgi:RNA polymerase sigma factor (TIGR02999 family)